MAGVDGRWNMVVKTPLGDQKGVLTVTTHGNRWSGSISGGMGSAEITDGVVDGDTIRWTMRVTTPMTLALEGSASVQGDALQGSVAAGVLGSFPLSGTRA